MMEAVDYVLQDVHFDHKVMVADKANLIGLFSICWWIYYGMVSEAI